MNEAQAKGNRRTLTRLSIVAVACRALRSAARWKPNPQTATTGVERNYGYMFQWWAMAAAALGFGLYAARHAAKKSAGA